MSGAVTGTATGVKGAQLQEARRPKHRSLRAPQQDPASRRSSCSPGPLEPPPAPRGPWVARGGGN